MIDPDLEDHGFDVGRTGQIDHVQRVRHARSVIVGNGQGCELDIGCADPRRSDEFAQTVGRMGLRHGNGGVHRHGAEAVPIVKGVPGPVGHPRVLENIGRTVERGTNRLALRVDPARRRRQDVFHIPPGQIRVDSEHDSDRSGCRGCGGGGASERTDVVTFGVQGVSVDQGAHTQLAETDIDTDLVGGDHRGMLLSVFAARRHNP